jgi:hypothetical protein
VCCVVAILAFLGPRAGILVWWLLDPARWETAFSIWIWPLLGSLFLPWTTLGYVLVAPGGIHGLDWLLLVMAVVVDVSTVGGGRYSRKRRKS